MWNQEMVPGVGVSWNGLDCQLDALVLDAMQLEFTFFPSGIEVGFKVSSLATIMPWVPHGSLTDPSPETFSPRGRILDISRLMDPVGHGAASLKTAGVLGPGLVSDGGILDTTQSNGKNVFFWEKVGGSPQTAPDIPFYQLE